MDELRQVIEELCKTNDYLKIEELKDGYGYKIYAKNAYVGIWVAKEKYFLISKYKGSLLPRLSYEYHWDHGEHWDHFADPVFGTAKPLEELEKCPFWETIDAQKGEVITAYLDSLEKAHSILPGYDTVERRKEDTLKWMGRLKSRTRPGRIPIHRAIKEGKLQDT